MIPTPSLFALPSSPMAIIFGYYVCVRVCAFVDEGVVFLDILTPLSDPMSTIDKKTIIWTLEGIFQSPNLFLT